MARDAFDERVTGKEKQSGRRFHFHAYDAVATYRSTAVSGRDAAAISWLPGKPCTETAIRKREKRAIDKQKPELTLSTDGFVLDAAYDAV